MAKWAIVNGETGQLTDIVDEADKFEIYEGADADLKWMEVPDDTTYEHYMVNGVCVHRDDVEDAQEDAEIDREQAYGTYRASRWTCSIVTLLMALLNGKTILQTLKQQQLTQHYSRIYRRP